MGSPCSTTVRWGLGAKPPSLEVAQKITPLLVEARGPAGRTPCPRSLSGAQTAASALSPPGSSSPSPVLRAPPPSLHLCRVPVCVSAPAEPDLGSSSAAGSGAVAAASRRARRRAEQGRGGEQAGGHSAKPRAARVPGPAREGAGRHTVLTLAPHQSCRGIREVTGPPGVGGVLWGLWLPFTALPAQCDS